MTRNGHPPDVGPPPYLGRPVRICVWGPIIQKAPRMHLITQGGPRRFKHGVAIVAGELGTLDSIVDALREFCRSLRTSLRLSVACSL